MSPESIPLPPNESYWASSEFRTLCRRLIGEERWSEAEARLAEMGQLAAGRVSELGAAADANPARLVTHDARGHRISRVEHSSAALALKSIAHQSRLLTSGARSASEAIESFARGYLLAMGSAATHLSLSLSDCVARAVSKSASAERREQILPHLNGSSDEVWYGGTFLTERSGGSDVGANETAARRLRDGSWVIDGHKWFCSNADAEVVLLTARGEGGESGTRGLRTFLLLPRETSGFAIERLKPTAGVRAMVVGEVTLEQVQAEELGGFEVAADLLNLGRLYSAIGAVALVGRALREARHYVDRRHVFGRPVIEWPLAQEAFFDIEAEQVAALLLVFEAVDAFVRGEFGDEDAARRARLLVPMAKLVASKLAVPAVSEAMELVGGNGYVEESPMPRLLRDAQAFPIWEGTTNIVVLDGLRVMYRESVHESLLARVRKAFAREADALAYSFESLDEYETRGWLDRLARLLELTLLTENGYGEFADRLRNRPLGMLPGAHPWV